MLPLAEAEAQVAEAQVAEAQVAEAQVAEAQAAGVQVAEAAAALVVAVDCCSAPPTFLELAFLRSLQILLH
jgi:hypothetical protein